MSHTFTNTLLKAFDILNCFSLDTQELGIKELAQLLDMPQSSVYRIVQSMEFSGLIFQNAENRKYRLGPKLLSLSAKQDMLRTCQEISVKHMRRLAQETGETVNLACRDCDRIMYMHRIECSHVLRPNFTLQASYPAHSTALGLVLMSELSESNLQWIYEKNAEDISMNFKAFTAAITEVRRHGYAYDDQVFCEGLRCTAAPIRGPGGGILFSVSVSAPTLRMNDITYEATRQAVVRCCAAASEEIAGL